MKPTMIQRVLSFFFSTVLVFGLIPTYAFAGSMEPAGGGAGEPDVSMTLTTDGEQLDAQEATGLSFTSSAAVEVRSWQGLQDAINGASSSREIRLACDITCPSGKERIKVDGKTVTIDLNGHVLNRNLKDRTDNGNVIEVYKNSLLIIKDGTATESSPGTGKITGGYPKRGGGIYVNQGGNLKIESGTIADNNSAWAGGGIYLLGNLEMTGGSIIGNTAGESGGGIFAGSESTIKLSNAIITGNTAGDSGGGAAIKSHANSTISNCEITSNSAGDTGGGIYSDSEGYTLTITDTKIDDNTSGDDGAGIYLYWDKIVMNGGSLRGNITNKDSGGIKVTRKTTFTATGVDISKNKALGNEGGGIKNFGTTKLTNCTISNNTAKLEGGGIYNGDDDDSAGDLTITNCEITSNSTESVGGGIYSNKKLKIDGASITKNHAGGGGNGVFIGSKSSNPDIQGNLVVKDNGATPGAQQIYLCFGKKLSFSGALVEDGENGAQIGVTMQSMEFHTEDGVVGTFTSGYKDKNGTTDPTKFFFSPEGLAVSFDGDGKEAQIASGWKSLQKRIDAASKGENHGLVTLERDYAAAPTSKMIFVGSSDDRLKIPANGTAVTIDLNGHTLNRNLSDRQDDGHVIEVMKGATLTITDSSAEKTGTITGGYSKQGGGIFVNDNGKLNLRGGTITGNTATEDGGGVCVKGSLTMTGGIIAGNHAKEDGGGIYSTGTLTLAKDTEAGTFGTISNNSSDCSGGGIFATSDSKIGLSNATITGNEAGDNGGGVCINSKTNSTIENCEIVANKASDYGGGLYSEMKYATLTITDTKIDENTSGDDGAGIYLYWDKIVMNGGSLSGNITNKDGGGIKVTPKTTFTATGVDISNNKALGNEGGGIKNFGTTTLTNCTINDNSSKLEGGGVFNNKDSSSEGSVGELTLTNCTITGNKTTESNGGGVYSSRTLHINGGLITGNSAEKGGGGGIWIGLDAETTSISGGITITGNTAAHGNDLHLREGKVLTLTGEITGTEIGSIDMEKAGVFTKDYSKYHPRNASIVNPDDDPNNPNKFFATSADAIPAEWTLLQTEAQLNSDWPDLQKLIDRAAAGENNHRVTLERDYTASSTDVELMIKKNTTVIIDLAGHTLSRNLTSWKDDGNVIEVFEGATLTIEDSSAKGDDPGTGLITGGYPKRGGGVYVNKTGNLKITGGSISGNNSRWAGGGIYLLGNLEMTGGSIIGNTAGESGGGIFAGSESSTKLSNAIIANNKASDSGGGAAIKSHANSSIANCTIVGNEANDTGGGLYVDMEGYKLTITDTTIDDNTTGDDGGGIYLQWDTIVMTGGSISGNTASNDGGGVKVTPKTTFTATGVEICGNHAVSKEGGGIKSFGTTTLTNCTINDNSSRLEGGGVFNNKDGSSAGVLTLKNCTVEGNSSMHNGGGVYSSKTLKIIGGTITGNTSASNGGGVFAGRDSDDVGIEGAPVVKDNTAEAFGDDMYLRSGKKLALTGALTDAAEIRVDLEDSLGILTKDYKTWNQTSDPYKYFVPATGYDLVFKNGEVEITSDWKRLKDRVENASSGATIKLDGDLDKDFAAGPSDDRIKIKGDKRITIDLNGHTVNRNRQSKTDDGHVFEVFGGSELTIADSSAGKTGTVTGGWSGSGGGIYVNEKGKLNLQGGTVTGNRASSGGGGICVHGTLNMTGGVVAANKAGGSGGGIELGEGGELYLSGGTVTGNKASKDGGGIMPNESAKISLSGSPVVRGNEASRSGNDIYLPSSNKLIVTGAFADSAQIGVAKEGDWGTFTSGYSNHNSGDPASYFASTQGFAVYLESGEATLGLDTYGETEYEKPFVDRDNQVTVNPNSLSSVNWMSGISGERYLNDINLPGSHDSGMNEIQGSSPNGLDFTSLIGAANLTFTRYFADGYATGANYAKTQTKFINEQLAEGARILDIRLNDRYKESKWYFLGGYGWADDHKNVWVSHGTSPATGNYTACDEDGDLLSFSKVLDWVKDFLEKHPTETIILHIRPQYTEGDHDSTIYKRTRSILEKSALLPNSSTGEPFLYKEADSKSYFAPYKHMPQLKDCRGKIVLFFEGSGGVDVCGGFYKGSKFFQFDDPTHFSSTAEKQVEAITDSYLSMNGGDVLLPADANTNSSDLWHWELNCTGQDDILDYIFSGVFLGENPVDLAHYVNPRLVGDGKLFCPEIAGQYIGWVKMDAFEAKYAETIWRTNFFDRLQYCTVTVKSGLDNPNYPDQTYKLLKGTEIEIPGNIYKKLKTDTYLSGWKATGEQLDTLCNPGETFTIDEDITFTAQWLNVGEIPVRIVWKDGDNTDKLRPKSVNLTVSKRVGEASQATDSTLTLTEEEGWSGVVEGDITSLSIEPQSWDPDHPIGEDTTGRYSYALSLEGGIGYVLTFCHTPQAVVAVAGTITWDDNDNADGSRPESVTIHLRVKGSDTDIDSQTVTADDGWGFDFGERAKYSNGEEVEYLIIEDDIEGYSTIIDGFTVTNTLTTSGQNVAEAMGMVEWDDADNVRGTRPSKAVVRLKANDEEIASLEVTDNGSDLWMFDFGSVPISDADGQRIFYAVAVDEISGYTSQVTDLTPDMDNSTSEEGYPSVYSFVVTNTLVVPDEDKTPAEVDAAPQPYDDLVYDGNAQSLVKPGDCIGGTLMYALGEDNQTAPSAESFTEERPTGTDAGPYYIWYYVKGDVLHLSTDPVCIQTSIAPKSATVTAESEEFTYDGTAHSNAGYDVEGLVGEDVIEAAVEGSITFPSQSPVANVVTSYKFTAGTPDNYSVITKNGELTMINASRKITITAASASKEYDGSALTAPSVTVTSGELIAGDELVAEASGSATNVADAKAGNNPVKAGYKVMRGDMDVTASYDIETQAGTLTIDPRPVTVSARSEGFTYDGKAHSNAGYDVAGLAGDDQITAVVEGSITFPDNSPVANVVKSYGFAKGTPGNYSVTVKNGELTMVNASRTITITAASKTWTYNGRAHSAPAVTVTSGELFEGDELVATATGSVMNASDTKAGNNPIAEGYKVMHGDVNVTANYVIRTQAGTLTVNKRSVVFIGMSETKDYTGSEIEISTVLESGTVPGRAGLAPGHTHNVVFSAKGTEPGGPYMGTITPKEDVVIKDGEKDVTANYDVEVENGELTIVMNSEKLTVSLFGKVYSYDGQPHALPVAATTNAPAETTTIEYRKGGGEWTKDLSSLTATDVGRYTIEVRATNPKYPDPATSSAELTIVQDPAMALEVSLEGASFTYDGEAHALPAAATTNALSDKTEIKYRKDGTEWTSDLSSLTATDVADSCNVQVRATNPNYANEAISSAALTIEKRKVTLSSEGGSKVYDGAALTKPEATVDGDGFVAGEVSNVHAIGSVTDVAEGEVANAVAFTEGEGFKAGNYDISRSEGKLSIEKRPVTFTGTSETREYAGSAITINEVAVSSGEDEGLVTGHTHNVEFSATGTDVAGSPYEGTITAEEDVKIKSGETNVTGNYDVAVVNGSLTVEPAALTITADSANREYNGQPLADEGWQDTAPAGLKGSDAVESVDVAGSVAGVGTAANVASNAVIKRGEAVATGNYAITYVDGTLEVTPSTTELKVASADGEWTYGGDAHAKCEYTVTYGKESYSVAVAAGASTGTATLSTGDTVTITPDASATVADVAQGTVSNAFVYAVDNPDCYSNQTKAEGALSVTPKTVTVTAQDKAFTYDGTAQSWGKYDVEGLVGGDEISAVVEGSITFPSEGTVANKLKSYGFTKGDPRNYSVTAKDGELTMKNASRTIIITAASASKTYDGAALTAPGVKVTLGELFEGDELVAEASGSTTDVADTKKGNNPIKEGYKVMHGTENVTASYDIATQAGTLSITKRPVIFTGKSETKTYTGSAITINEVAVSSGKDEGFVLGHTHNVEFSATGTEVGGPYEGTITAKADIVITSGETDVTGNYEIAVENGALTIVQDSQMELEVSLEGASFTYDGEAHALPAAATTNALSGETTIEYSKDGESWTENLSELTATDVADSCVIQVRATNPNYANAATSSAKLAIGKRKVTLSSEGGSKVYDGAALTKPGATVGGDGFVAGEASGAHATGSVTDVAEGEVANTVAFDEGDGFKAGNYDISRSEGTLKVTPATVTITARSEEFTYDGKAHSNVGYDVTGLVGEDAIEAVVEGSIAFPNESPVANVVTSYKFTTGTPENYSVTTEAGELTMKNASRVITITAASASKIYDGSALTAPAVTVTSGELFEGDELVAEAAGSATDVADTKMGNNPVKAGYRVMHGDVDVTASYVIAAEAGTLAVAPARATIVVADASKVAGKADPAFTGTVEGLVAEGDLGEVSYKRTNSDEAPGTYEGVLTVEYTANPNYEVTVTNGNFTIVAKGVYVVTSGAGGTWEVGSNQALGFTGERTVDPETTFVHFTGIEVDGKAVPERDDSGKANWTARSGSVIIELQPAYLETLPVGKHTLTALFDDGDPASAEFNVAAKASPSPTPSNNGNASSGGSTVGSAKGTSPKTGDPLAGAPLAALALAAAAALCLVIAALLRRRRSD